MATSAAPADFQLVLDTDVFSDWSRGRPHAIAAVADYRLRLGFLPMLTAITAFEVERGFESLLVKHGVLDPFAQQIGLL